MKTNSILTAALLAASSLIQLQPAFGQGDLNPPAGPPAPTMKSLDQVEPRILLSASNTPGNATYTFIISAPGSYYLTGNFTGEAGKHGISIQADDVTLDLNGFALISGGGGATRGINVPAAQTNLCIRNGSVRGWTGGGVRADAAVTLAEKLRLSDNTGATGLTVGLGSIVKDCLATNNATGFSAGDRIQICSCISTVNTNVGFNCGSYVTLLDCTASRNSGTGIVVGGTSTVSRCTSSRNIPSGYGIQAGSGCTIADCTVGSNGLDGINVDAACTVRGCTVLANGSFGIRALNGRSHITGNTCDANDEGIYVDFSSGNGIRNRVEGNNCTNNTSTGILINSTSNCVVRNSCSGNGTNYLIPAGNAAGPIVSAAGTATTTSPWANFSY